MKKKRGSSYISLSKQSCPIIYKYNLKSPIHSPPGTAAEDDGVSLKPNVLPEVGGDVPPKTLGAVFSGLAPA